MGDGMWCLLDGDKVYKVLLYFFIIIELIFNEIFNIGEEEVVCI